MPDGPNAMRNPRVMSENFICRLSVLAAMLTMIVVNGCLQGPHAGTNMSHAERLEEDKYIVTPDYLTYDESLSSVKEHQQAVESAMESFRHDEAHVAMHAIVHLIPSLPISAANSQLSPADRALVKEATETLSQAFAKLDHSLHDRDAQEVKYADVSTNIDQAMQVLDDVQKRRDRP